MGVARERKVARDDALMMLNPLQLHRMAVRHGILDADLPCAVLGVSGPAYAQGPRSTVRAMGG